MAMFLLIPMRTILAVSTNFERGPSGGEFRRGESMEEPCKACDGMV